MAREPERVNLGSLDGSQLMQAKRAMEGDIQRLAESLAFLNKSAQLYSAADGSMKELSDAKEGTVASTDQVLIDIGTGYFVEMTVEQGHEYFKRKVDKVKANMDEIQQIIKMKQSTLVMVERELSERMSQQAPRGA